MNLIFDLDGTLCYPGKFIDIQYMNILKEINKKYHTAICSGASPRNIISQLNDIELYKGFNEIAAFNATYIESADNLITKKFPRFKFFSLYSKILLNFRFEYFISAGMLNLKFNYNKFDKVAILEKIIVPINKECIFKACFAGRSSVNIFKTGKENILNLKNYKNVPLIFFCDQGRDEFYIDYELSRKITKRNCEKSLVHHVSSPEETFDILERVYL